MVLKLFLLKSKFSKLYLINDIFISIYILLIFVINIILFNEQNNNYQLKKILNK